MSDPRGTEGILFKTDLDIALRLDLEMNFPQIFNEVVNVQQPKWEGSDESDRQ